VKLTRDFAGVPNNYFTFNKKGLTRVTYLLTFNKTKKYGFYIKWRVTPTSEVRKAVMLALFISMYGGLQ